MFLLFIGQIIPTAPYIFSTFFLEFDSHVESIKNKSGHLVITGDFNIHLNGTHNISTKKIIDILTHFAYIITLIFPHTSQVIRWT